MENTENSEVLNFIIYNLLSEQLTGIQFRSLNEIDLNYLNNKELMSYIRLIIKEKEVRLQLLKDYPQKIAKINTDYQKLIIEKENILKNPFLTIYLKEKLNRKPPKQFIIFGFIIVSLIISTLFTCILLYEKILRKVINKKLKAL